MHFMQIESVLQTKNRSEPAKNWFSVALRVSVKKWADMNWPCVTFGDGGTFLQSSIKSYQKLIMPVWSLLCIAN